MKIGFLTFFNFWVILASSALLSQDRLAYSEMGTCLNPASPISNMENEETQWNEDVSARTLTTSTYYSTDGQVKIRQSSRPINYYGKSGDLEPIQIELERLDQRTYAALNQPFPTFLYNDGSFSLSIDDMNSLIHMGSNCKILGEKIKTEFDFTGRKITMFDVIPSIDKEIIMRENGIKSNYILHNNFQGVQGGIVFSEDVELPTGYTIINDISRGSKTKFGWRGNLLVLDESGRVVSTFHEALCYDQGNNYEIASYSIRKENEKFVVETVVDANWLNSPERVFPIIIDPLVTGPTAAWTGGYMPSCFVPTYNQDSLLVTIPGGISVTQLNVTASFYADPFTSAWMQDGAMYFSTDCGQSQNFSITGVAGQSAGTAYLDYFNLFNPMTCCFAESCNAQTFWLSFHLGRTLWGAGCNTTYIRYDPFTTSWPFEATIVGKTPESYAVEWLVPSTPLCANTCSVLGTGYVRYGVPPYTFTHPWSNDTITQGTNIGCSTGATSYQFTLDIPNCPTYCDTVNTSLTVPPPTIIDACGVAVAGLPNKFVQIKPVPNVVPVYDSIICSEEQLNVNLVSCIPGSNVYWDGNGNTGTNNIVDVLVNNSASISTVNYQASAEYNGCFSDTINVPVYVEPLPIPAYSTNPNPIISGLPIIFIDETVFNSTVGISWIYTFGDGSFEFAQNPIYTYTTPGEYEICLKVVNAANCIDSICELITVVPAEVSAPNVVTANNDGVNDLLVFKYLEFYPDNELTVVNRWGNLIYEKKGYMNDWNPVVNSEGTYYYILKINGVDKDYNGFFQLVK